METNMQRVKFLHPFTNEEIEMTLPRSITFADVTKQLYENGFLTRKKGDYQYIIGERLCGLGDRLENYVPASAEECLEIRIHGLLTVLV